MNKKRKNIIVIVGLVIMAFMVYNFTNQDKVTKIEDLGTFDLT